MNERIKELALKCTPAYQQPNFDAEKFAKLIVQECANIVLHYADVDEGVAVAKKHFGVEE